MKRQDSTPPILASREKTHLPMLVYQSKEILFLTFAGHVPVQILDIFFKFTDKMRVGNHVDSTTKNTGDKMGEDGYELSRTTKDQLFTQRKKIWYSLREDLSLR
jgi:hypothetical protein